MSLSSLDPRSPFAGQSAPQSPQAKRSEPQAALQKWIRNYSEAPGAGNDYGYRWQPALIEIASDLQDLRSELTSGDWEEAQWHIAHLLRPSLTSADRQHRAAQVLQLIHEINSPDE